MTHNNNNNTSICKAHNVSIRAESEVLCTLQALQVKHPGRLHKHGHRNNQCPGSDTLPVTTIVELQVTARDNPRFESLQVSKEYVMRALRAFPLGSSGGPDGITPQHIRDLLIGSTDENLQQALVDFVSLMLARTFDKEVNSRIFGGRLIALSKKDGGIRPISVGYTLRRLAAKCTNNHVIAKRSKALQPQQLGVGVSGGAEAAVHAARRLVSNLPSDHVIVKLDFSNAFNCIRRDLILYSIATNIPEIYRLVYSAYSCEPVFGFSEHDILSSVRVTGIL